MKTIEMKQFKTGQLVVNYVEQRDYVINEIMNVVRTVYRDDKEMIAACISLTVDLKCAEPSPIFVNDLKGFMMWSSMTNKDAAWALSTILHDLSEFSRNRNQSWFCPRTTGYSKYLTGASGK